MSISNVEAYFNKLVDGNKLPPFFGEFDGTHNINRISDIKTIYKEDSCGVVPFRVTDRGSGNLAQAPLSASSYILIEGEPNKGENEKRRNPVYRILGGPLPTDNLILHLVAEGKSGYCALMFQFTNGKQPSISVPLRLKVQVEMGVQFVMGNVYPKNGQLW